MQGVIYYASAANNAAQHYLFGNKGLKQAWEDGKDHAASINVDQNIWEGAAEDIWLAKKPFNTTSLSAAVQNFVLRLVTLTPALAGKFPAKETWIENIPKWPAIFATTHLSDQDVLLAANSIRNHGKEIWIGSQSTNFEAPIVAIPQRLAWWTWRFFPISSRKASKKIQGSEWDYSLQSEDFLRMSEAGKIWISMIIAWHRPTHDGKLPPKAGLWAVILAHRNQQPLIPCIVTGKTFHTKLEFAPAIELTELTAPQRDVLNKWIDGKWRLTEEVFGILRADSAKLRNAYVQYLKNV